MSALDQITRLGASMGLGGDGELFLDGLDKLPREKAARAINIAKAHKESLRRALKGEPCCSISGPDLAKIHGKQIAHSDDASDEVLAKAISLVREVFGDVEVKFIPHDAFPPMSKREVFWPGYRPSPNICQACDHLVASEYCRWNVDYRGGKCPRHLNSLTDCPAGGFAIVSS